jgi:hypothetical protein
MPQRMFCDRDHSSVFTYIYLGELDLMLCWNVSKGFKRKNGDFLLGIEVYGGKE